MPLQLYSYYRSSAAYRVRIALNLKGLEYEYKSVYGLRRGDPALTERYLALNPQGLVPVLIDGEHAFSQSLAIMEYLEERYPDPPLLPRDPLGRAHVRSIALYIACEIHPVSVMRVRKYMTRALGASLEDKRQWYHHWVREGFGALEAILGSSSYTGKCCHEDRPSLADICLVPQVYNAERFKIPMDGYPTLRRISHHCLTLPEFASAQPNLQPDVSEYDPNEEY